MQVEDTTVGGSADLPVGASFSALGGSSSFPFNAGF